MDAVDASRRALEIDLGIARRDTFTPPRSSGWATRTKAARKCRCFNGCRLRTAKHARARSSWGVCGARHRCHARRATTAMPSSCCDARSCLEPRAPASHLDLGVALLEGGQAAEAMSASIPRPRSTRLPTSIVSSRRRTPRWAGKTRARRNRPPTSDCGASRSAKRAGFGETRRAHRAVPRGPGASGVWPTRDERRGVVERRRSSPTSHRRPASDFHHVNGAQPRPSPLRDHERRRAVLRLRQRRLARRLPGGRRLARQRGDRRDRAPSSLSQSRQRHISGRHAPRPASRTTATAWAPAPLTSTTTAGPTSTSPASARTRSITTTAASASRDVHRRRAGVGGRHRSSAPAARSPTSIATATSISSSSTTSMPASTTTSSAATSASKYRIYCHPLNFAPLRNTLYRNNGNGTFTDVSKESGILDHRGNGLGVVFGDYDDDGLGGRLRGQRHDAELSVPQRAGRTFSEMALLSGVVGRERRQAARRHGDRLRRLRRRRRSRPVRHAITSSRRTRCSAISARACSRTRHSRAASVRRRSPTSASARPSSTTTTTPISISASSTAM